MFKDGELVTEERILPSGTDPVVAGVNAALESIPAVAPEARLEDTKRDGKTLTLQFTTSFIQTYGTDDESAVISSIMKAVSLNSDAEYVIFETVTGQPIETLGSASLEGPQSVVDWIGG